MNRRLEIESPVSDRAGELKDRQNQFAALLGLDPEQLRGLKFCSHCGGEDYEWTDWSRSPIDPNDFVPESEEEELPDTEEYRSYLGSVVCKHCDGTGFEGGSSFFSKARWRRLGALPTK